MIGNKKMIRKNTFMMIVEKVFRNKSITDYIKIRLRS